MLNKLISREENHGYEIQLSLLLTWYFLAFSAKFLMLETISSPWAYRPAGLSCLVEVPTWMARFSSFTHLCLTTLFVPRHHVITIFPGLSENESDSHRHWSAHRPLARLHITSSTRGNPAYFSHISHRRLQQNLGQIVFTRCSPLWQQPHLLLMGTNPFTQAQLVSNGLHSGFREPK